LVTGNKITKAITKAVTKATIRMVTEIRRNVMIIKIVFLIWFSS
jgi:hypothetical protein